MVGSHDSGHCNADHHVRFNERDIATEQIWEQYSTDRMQKYKQSRGKSEQYEMGVLFGRYRCRPATVLQDMLDGKVKHYIHESDEGKSWDYVYEVDFEKRKLTLIGDDEDSRFDVPLSDDKTSYILTKFRAW